MKSKTRGVRESTLIKKVSRWKPVLKLKDWDISIRYAKQKELESVQKKDSKKIIFGWVDDCDSAAKRASILINRNYHTGPGHKTSWNIDTLIIHELVHVVLWAHSENIPENIRKHSKVFDFEEFVCDSFADIIYCIFVR